MKLILIIFTVVFFAGCAGTGYLPPQPYNFDNSRVIESDFETTWARIISWFSETGNQIKNMDKSSGFIATEEIRFSSKYCDCGILKGIYSVPVLENAGNHSAIGTMNVLLTKLGNGNTKVTVNTCMSFSYTMSGLANSTRYDCLSKGLIEDAILRYLSEGNSGQ